MPLRVETAASHMKLQSFAALHDHAMNLLDRVALHARLGGNRLEDADLQAAQQRAGAHGMRIRAIRAEDLSQQLVRKAAPIVAIARELLPVVLKERAFVALDGLDADAIAPDNDDPNADENPAAPSVPQDRPLYHIG